MSSSPEASASAHGDTGTISTQPPLLPALPTALTSPLREQYQQEREERRRAQAAADAEQLAAATAAAAAAAAATPSSSSSTSSSSALGASGGGGGGDVGGDNSGGGDGVMLPPMAASPPLSLSASSASSSSSPSSAIPSSTTTRKPRPGSGAFNLPTHMPPSPASPAMDTVPAAAVSPRAQRVVMLEPVTPPPPPSSSSSTVTAAHAPQLAPLSEPNQEATAVALFSTVVLSQPEPPPPPPTRINHGYADEAAEDAAIAAIDADMAAIIAQRQRNAATAETRRQRRAAKRKTGGNGVTSLVDDDDDDDDCIDDTATAAAAAAAAAAIDDDDDAQYRIDVASVKAKRRQRNRDRERIFFQQQQALLDEQQRKLVADARVAKRKKQRRRDQKGGGDDNDSNGGEFDDEANDRAAREQLVAASSVAAYTSQSCVILSDDVDAARERKHKEKLQQRRDAGGNNDGSGDDNDDDDDDDDRHVVWETRQEERESLENLRRMINNDKTAKMMAAIGIDSQIGLMRRHYSQCRMHDYAVAGRRRAKRKRARLRRQLQHKLRERELDLEQQRQQKLLLSAPSSPTKTAAVATSPSGVGIRLESGGGGDDDDDDDDDDGTSATAANPAGDAVTQGGGDAHGDGDGGDDDDVADNSDDTRNRSVDSNQIDDISDTGDDNELQPRRPASVASNVSNVSNASSVHDEYQRLMKARLRAAQRSVKLTRAHIGFESSMGAWKHSVSESTVGLLDRGPLDRFDTKITYSQPAAIPVNAAHVTQSSFLGHQSTLVHYPAKGMPHRVHADESVGSSVNHSKAHPVFATDKNVTPGPGAYTTKTVSLSTLTDSYSGRVDIVQGTGGKGLSLGGGAGSGNHAAEYIFNSNVARKIGCHNYDTPPVVFEFPVYQHLAADGTPVASAGDNRGPTRTVYEEANAARALELKQQQEEEKRVHADKKMSRHALRIKTTKAKIDTNNKSKTRKEQLETMAQVAELALSRKHAATAALMSAAPSSASPSTAGTSPVLSASLRSHDTSVKSDTKVRKHKLRKHQDIAAAAAAAKAATASIPLSSTQELTSSAPLTRPKVSLPSASYLLSPVPQAITEATYPSLTLIEAATEGQITIDHPEEVDDDGGGNGKKKKKKKKKMVPKSAVAPHTTLVTGADGGDSGGGFSTDVTLPCDGGSDGDEDGDGDGAGDVDLQAHQEMVRLKHLRARHAHRNTKESQTALFSAIVAPRHARGLSEHDTDRYDIGKYQPALPKESTSAVAAHETAVSNSTGVQRLNHLSKHYGKFQQISDASGNVECPFKEAKERQRDLDLRRHTIEVEHVRREEAERQQAAEQERRAALPRNKATLTVVSPDDDTTKRTTSISLMVRTVNRAKIVNNHHASLAVSSEPPSEVISAVDAARTAAAAQSQRHAKHKRQTSNISSVNGHAAGSATATEAAAAAAAASKLAAAERVIVNPATMPVVSAESAPAFVVQMSVAPPSEETAEAAAVGTGGSDKVTSVAGHIHPLVVSSLSTDGSISELASGRSVASPTTLSPTSEQRRASRRGSAKSTPPPGSTATSRQLSATHKAHDRLHGFAKRPSIMQNKHKMATVIRARVLAAARGDRHANALKEPAMHVLKGVKRFALNRAGHRSLGPNSYHPYQFETQRGKHANNVGVVSMHPNAAGATGGSGIDLNASGLTSMLSGPGSGGSGGAAGIGGGGGSGHRKQRGGRGTSTFVDRVDLGPGRYDVVKAYDKTQVRTRNANYAYHMSHQYQDANGIVCSLDGSPLIIKPPHPGPGSYFIDRFSTHGKQQVLYNTVHLGAHNVEHVMASSFSSADRGLIPHQRGQLLLLDGVSNSSRRRRKKKKVIVDPALLAQEVEDDEEDNEVDKEDDDSDSGDDIGDDSANGSGGDSNNSNSPKPKRQKKSTAEKKASKKNIRQSKEQQKESAAKPKPVEEYDAYGNPLQSVDDYDDEETLLNHDFELARRHIELIKSGAFSPAHKEAERKRKKEVRERHARRVQYNATHAEKLASDKIQHTLSRNTRRQDRESKVQASKCMAETMVHIRLARVVMMVQRPRLLREWRHRSAVIIQRAFRMHLKRQQQRAAQTEAAAGFRQMRYATTLYQKLKRKREAAGIIRRFFFSVQARSGPFFHVMTNFRKKLFTIQRWWRRHLVCQEAQVQLNLLYWKKVHDGNTNLKNKLLAVQRQRLTLQRQRREQAAHDKARAQKRAATIAAANGSLHVAVVDGESLTDPKLSDENRRAMQHAESSSAMTTLYNSSGMAGRGGPRDTAAVSLGVDIFEEYQQVTGMALDMRDIENILDIPLKVELKSRLVRELLIRLHRDYHKSCKEHALRYNVFLQKTMSSNKHYSRDTTNDAQIEEARIYLTGRSRKLEAKRAEYLSRHPYPRRQFLLSKPLMKALINYAYNLHVNTHVTALSKPSYAKTKKAELAAQAAVTARFMSPTASNLQRTMGMKPTPPRSTRRLAGPLSPSAKRRESILPRSPRSPSNQ